MSVFYTCLWLTYCVDRPKSRRVALRVQERRFGSEIHESLQHGLAFAVVVEIHGIRHLCSIIRYEKEKSRQLRTLSVSSKPRRRIIPSVMSDESAETTANVDSPIHTHITMQRQDSIRF